MLLVKRPETLLANMQKYTRTHTHAAADVQLLQMHTGTLQSSPRLSQLFQSFGTTLSSCVFQSFCGLSHNAATCKFS